MIHYSLHTLIDFSDKVPLRESSPNLGGRYDN
jgi:hypothetical protein